MQLAPFRTAQLQKSSDWIPDCIAEVEIELKERWALLNTNRILLLILLTFLLCNLFPVALSGGAPRTISVIADKDNLFKIPGQKLPVITLKTNEVIHLRITANKSTEWDQKDGTVHTFTINALKDQGWDLRLKEGTQDFTLAAPAEPGNYVVECTIKCGQGHDDMKMRLVVIP